MGNAVPKSLGDEHEAESDQALISRLRSGEREAFGELWLRHHRAAHWVAREFTSIDPDDLVSQAYLAILETIQRGGGPSGPFRPYLYMVVRNLARRWGSRDHEITVDAFTQLVDGTPSPDETARSIEHALVAKAFSHLPERWQSVLWYTEVEGMKPREIAPLLGISENSVSALAYRARAGLRQQWVQSHVSTVRAEGECAWALGRLGEYLQEGLNKRDAKRMLAHLGECEQCRAAGAEAKQLSSQLAYSMIPLLLGGAVGSAWLSTFGPGAAASAASLGSAGIGATAAAGTGTGMGAGAVAGSSVAGAAAGGTAAVALSGAAVVGITMAGAASLIAALVVPGLLSTDGDDDTRREADAIAEPSNRQSAGEDAPEAAPPIDGPNPADTALIGEGAPVTTLIEELTETLVDDTLTPVVGGVGDGLNDIVGGVGGGVGDILDGVGGGLGDILDGVGSGTAGGIVDGVGSGVGTIVEGVGDGVGSVLDGVGGGVGDILDGLGGGLGNLFGKR